MNDWVHQHTPWKTFIHSCGSVIALLPDIIEAGFDILNPVQCSAAGMDPRTLKERFGGQITFWGGGVDTQKTLPFGTPDEVRRQVRERIEIFGRGGGFVFNTVHNVQAGTARREPPGAVRRRAAVAIETPCRPASCRVLASRAVSKFRRKRQDAASTIRRRPAHPPVKALRSPAHTQYLFGGRPADNMTFACVCRFRVHFRRSFDEEAQDIVGGGGVGGIDRRGGGAEAVLPAPHGRSGGGAAKAEPYVVVQTGDDLQVMTRSEFIAAKKSAAEKYKQDMKDYKEAKKQAAKSKEKFDGPKPVKARAEAGRQPSRRRTRPTRHVRSGGRKRKRARATRNRRAPKSADSGA